MNRFIAEFEESEGQKVNKLLTELELDDKNPSQLLREMRSLAGTQVNDDFLRTIFILRLLINVPSTPIRLKKHVISKIRKHFKEWQNLKKNKENKKKSSEALKNKEQDWQQKLEDLFDIAHCDALSIMTVKEDKQFLLGQRKKGRQGVIGLVDRKSLLKWKKMEEKKSRI
ncbi:hypothetical protein RN001_013995 [Aquatica leii]|uniref:Uncharacterized protein n=1 Tax=Aquatica leii TaxID=1421715 RepID=A0AAN7SNY1_9COLE|nr:hypothetical protein RN001_013995 [Aquatica leii]